MNISITPQELTLKLKTLYRTESSTASAQELGGAIAALVSEKCSERWADDTERQLSGRYAAYLSMEFLMGRAIGNNLLELGIYDEVDKLLKEINGIGAACFEDVEDEALGNGGLGRLAACFLESAATLGKPLRGYGIRYKYGIFKQAIENGFQKEYPDDWTRFGDQWSVRRDLERVSVRYSDMTVAAIPYDMPIFGYGNGSIGTLRLWQAEGDIESGSGFDFSLFNACRHNDASRLSTAAEDISKSLYPNDDEKSGKLLRLRQQYFFSAASLADIVRNHEPNSLSTLPDVLAIQLNDTHPVVAIPELIRIYMSKGFSFDEAFDCISRIFSYTNHTVMPEALEKWDCSLVKELLPEVYAVILRISERLNNELLLADKTDAEAKPLRIISDEKVHMANLAVYCSSHTNGVAELHTKILKDSVLNGWYELYPERFLNQTNGITQRRWLGLCNPKLAKLITSLLGDSSWMTDLSKLRELEKYADDPSIINAFKSIKSADKLQLAEYMEKHGSPKPDCGMIFDIQIKRLHEYKRQLMNALSILYIYYGIKDGSISDIPPVCFIFGAKSAPGYVRAKGIIKLINEISKLIENDSEVNRLLKVVFVENYNVSYAEKLVAAADISEQISTAGTEASGTGNMKLMLNGAVTLGTMDGANIEIVEEAGRENNYIFGLDDKELAEVMKDYCPRRLLADNPKLRRAAMALIDGTLSDDGTGIFAELYTSLLDGASWHKPDNYYVLGELEDYTATRLQAYADYFEKPDEFAKKCWLNICGAGKFSSDRTIAGYCNDIWMI